jgi:SAM-dependent methyltransferase
MISNSSSVSRHYVLATGSDAVGRLEVLHQLYSPAGRQALVDAGLKAGMTVADFGCGSGAMTRTIAAMVGPTGSVTGVDLHQAQVEQAARLCLAKGLVNTEFVVADATNTGLPNDHFDLVYCRFLLLHLTDPNAGLREMWRILKPGGILLVEDGDIASACSVPPTALDAFADLLCRLASMRNLDYSLANRLWHLVSQAGFSSIGLKVHQPSDRAGLSALLLRWSVQEAGPALVQSGLLTPDQLDATLGSMEAAAIDPDILTIAPRMSLVSARKQVD